MSVYYDAVVALISSVFSVDEDELSMSTDLLNGLNADDIDISELVSLCEEEFDIEIPEEDIEANFMNTVGDIVRYLDNLEGSL